MDEVTITALSMAHMFGINMYLAHTLPLGFKLIIMKKFEVKNYLYLIEKYQVIDILLSSFRRFYSLTDFPVCVQTIGSHC